MPRTCERGIYPKLRTSPSTNGNCSSPSRTSAMEGYIQDVTTFSGALMKLKIEVEREEDGRWIAEVPTLPGVLAYGKTEVEARARAQALALRVLADRLEH